MQLTCAVLLLLVHCTHLLSTSLSSLKKLPSQVRQIQSAASTSLSPFPFFPFSCFPCSVFSSFSCFCLSFSATSSSYNCFQHLLVRANTDDDSEHFLIFPVVLPCCSNACNHSKRSLLKRGVIECSLIVC